MPVQNLGRVSLNFRGLWVSGTSYKRLDIVTYLGTSYVALRDSSSIVFNQASEFELLAAKGSTGPQGPQGLPGLQGIPADPNTVGWDNVTSKPAEFPPANHSATKITSGLISDNRISSNIARLTTLNGVYSRITGLKYTAWENFIELPTNVTSNTTVAAFNAVWRTNPTSTSNMFEGYEARRRPGYTTYQRRKIYRTLS